jgi:hypothetical protein
MAGCIRVLATLAGIAAICLADLAAVGAQIIEQQGEYIEHVAQIGGAAKAVAVQDRYAYLGAGARLLMIDVADPAQPVLVGQSAVLPDVVQRLVLTGRHAIVAAGRAGLRVFDVSQPTAPREVAALPTTSPAEHVVLVDQYIYLPQPNGIHVLDAADPARLAEIAIYGTSHPPRGLQIVGRRAYVGIGEALHILDVSNPTTPTGLGSFPTRNAVVESIFIAANHAYVTAVWNGEDMDYIVDLSNPTSPLLRRYAEYGDPDFPGVPAVVIGNGAYVLTGNLGVLSIVNPAEPQWINLSNPDGMTGGPADIAVAGSYAYIADRSHGLRIVDIQDSTVPKDVGRYETSVFAQTVTISDGRAYVHDGGVPVGMVRILALDDPAQPRELGAYPVSAFMVAARGSYAYVPATTSVLILDTSDPTRPVEVSSYNWPGMEITSRVVVSDAHAYLDSSMSGTGRVRFLDVTNPANPTSPGYYDLPHAGGARPNVLEPGAFLSHDPRRDESAAGIVARGDYLYVAAVAQTLFWVPELAQSGQPLPGGLRIVDISNPAAPAEAGFLPTPTTFSLDVALLDRYALLLTWDGGARVSTSGGIHVVDVADPRSPREVAYHALPRAASRLAVDGSRVYLFGTDTVTILEFSDLLQPREVGWFRPPGSAASVGVLGDYVYVATGEAGLSVLRLAPTR